MANSFKASNGQYFLLGLFFEKTNADKSSVVYTLKDEDHLGYPSLYRLYMETNDPTEYQFSINHLGGWSHWEELSKCVWFQPYVQRWRRELSIKLKSEALARISQTAKGPGKEAFAANKYLIEFDTPVTKRGRPSKEEISKAAKEIVDDQKIIAEDFARLELN
jgi:hypothetical protein